MKKEFYINNRKRLGEKLNDHSIAVFFAGKEICQSLDEAYKFTINRTFYYLTGINEVNDILVLVKDNNKTKVTAVHKANVLKKTDGLFREIFYEVAKDYPDIATEDFYVDATAMYLITQPESFEVIVTTNLFGDILSDEGAGLVGGLGLIPSANIGEDAALFEPVHGSAPDIAGQNKANPIALMLSAIMMLRYLGENKEADRFEASILKVLNDANTLTGDLGGSATTDELASEVINNL